MMNRVRQVELLDPTLKLERSAEGKTVKFNSLQSRITVLLVIPVTAVLLVIGLAGYFYARQLMLDRWRESALLSLERAAHSIDMRLGEPADVVELVADPDRIHSLELDSEWLAASLESLPGVTGVVLAWSENAQTAGGGEMRAMSGSGRGGGGRRFRHVHTAKVTAPVYDAGLGQETVTLVIRLEGEEGATVGRLEIKMNFAYLLEGLTALDWWKSDAAVLVDHDGHILARTGGVGRKRVRLGENQNELEGQILQAVQDSPSGTFLGRGSPPERVAGFFRITRAPWALVLFSSGDKVLAPIIRYRNYYLFTGAACLAFIVLVIRLVTGRIVVSIGEVSLAATEVAKGEYGRSLNPRGTDEIGRLMSSFNAMVDGLRERDRIRDTFGRYVDHKVAKRLLAQPEATRLGGRKREVAIMMSDIRGFTPLCESLNPEQTIGVVNRYLARLIEVIHNYEGVIVDFLGDAILVFFDPLDETLEAAVHRAVCCALEMQRATADLNAAGLAGGMPPIETAIGLNVGEVVVGNIGSETRTKYGIIGAPVNLTQRLQSVAGGGETVISESIYGYVKDQLRVNRSFSARFKGIQGETRVFVVSGLDSCA